MNLRADSLSCLAALAIGLSCQPGQAEATQAPPHSQTTLASVVQDDALRCASLVAQMERRSGIPGSRITELVSDALEYLAASGVATSRVEILEGMSIALLDRFVESDLASTLASYLALRARGHPHTDAVSGIAGTIRAIAAKAVMDLEDAAKNIEAKEELDLDLARNEARDPVPDKALIKRASAALTAAAEKFGTSQSLIYELVTQTLTNPYELPRPLAVIEEFAQMPGEYQGRDFSTMYVEYGKVRMDLSHEDGMKAAARLGERLLASRK